MSIQQKQFTIFIECIISQRTKIDSEEPKSGNIKPEIEKNPNNKAPSPPQSPKKEESQYGVLPEGFFDDARKDAEARNVPFKDKMDAEMEAFQKELGTLNNVCFPYFYRLCCFLVDLCYVFASFRNWNRSPKGTMKKWLLRGTQRKLTSKCKCHLLVLAKLPLLSVDSSVYQCANFGLVFLDALFLNKNN